VWVCRRAQAVESARPKDHQIEAAFQPHGEAGGDVIIGLGGRSCIDAAKGMAIISGHGGRAGPSAAQPLPRYSGRPIPR
jgi:alcohol dehydrogenase class IV